MLVDGVNKKCSDRKVAGCMVSYDINMAIKKEAQEGKRETGKRKDNPVALHTEAPPSLSLSALSALRCVRVCVCVCTDDPRGGSQLQNGRRHKNRLLLLFAAITVCRNISAAFCSCFIMLLLLLDNSGTVDTDNLQRAFPLCKVRLLITQR